MVSDNLIISFPKIGSLEQGFLSVAEFGKYCPFQIKRVYWVYQCPEKTERGSHAHKEVKQILICLTGMIEVVLDDGSTRNKFILNSPYLGLYQPNLIWGSLKYHANSVLLVLASEVYSQDDYIFDYQDFKLLKNSKMTLA